MWTSCGCPSSPTAGSASWRVTPGVYSDFDDTAGRRVSHSRAKPWSGTTGFPAACRWLAGILYLNRFTVNWLPAGGIIWDPNDDVHLEILFPRPKFAYRFTSSALHEDWAVPGRRVRRRHLVDSARPGVLGHDGDRRLAGLSRESSARSRAAPRSRWKSATSSAARSSSSPSRPTTRRPTRS